MATFLGQFFVNEEVNDERIIFITYIPINLIHCKRIFFAYEAATAHTLHHLSHTLLSFIRHHVNQLGLGQHGPATYDGTKTSTTNIVVSNEFLECTSNAISSRA